MYINLLKARILEEKIVELYHQGRVPGSVHSGVGEEATFVGGCLALRKDDYMKYLKLFEEIKDVDRYYFGENKPTRR